MLIKLSNMTMTENDATETYPGQTRLSDGNPKVVVGLAGTKNLKGIFDTYRQTGRYPHATFDVDNNEIHYHVDQDRASGMLSAAADFVPHRRTISYWIIINRNSGDVLTPDEARKVYNCIVEHAIKIGADRNVYPFPHSAKQAMATEMRLWEWNDFSGVVAAAQVPMSVWHNALPLSTSALIDAWPEPGKERADEPEAAESVEKETADWGPFKGRPVSAGSRGKKVAQVRDKLGLPEGDLFDEDTDVAVKAFQESAGIEADGIVSAETWDALGDQI